MGPGPPPPLLRVGEGQAEPLLADPHIHEPRAEERVLDLRACGELSLLETSPCPQRLHELGVPTPPVVALPPPATRDAEAEASASSEDPIELSEGPARVREEVQGESTE